ncbi:MAG TPA: hypothetical protein VMS77_07970 [Conexivisphaerales archaeon]|nr:hypothetical protein [Conexivisphaerales archaeon]
MDVLTAMALVFASTFVPLIVGSFIGVLLGGSIGKGIVAAIGVGILTWLFVDLMSDAVDLDVAQGFGGGLTQAALVLCFIVAFVALVYLDKGFLNPGGLSFMVAILAAISLGLHSGGEAMDIGDGLAMTGVGSLLGAETIAFVTHKAIEGFMLSAFLVAGTSKPSLKDAVLLSGIVGVMAAVATPFGYFAIIPSTYLLAAASGGDIYMLLRLTPQAMGAGDRTKLAVAFCVGFLMIYFAALLHTG